MSLKDKVVLITGAGRGIGAGIAHCFAAKGAKIVITDLDQASIDATVKSLSTESMGFVADASSQVEMTEIIREVVAKLGSLDVLVNNAGVGGPKIEFQEFAAQSSFLGMSDDSWDEQLRYNLRTTFSSSNAAIPFLTDGGSIINIASIAGLGPSTQLPAYGAAKAGVIHLTKSQALELSPRRIRVNCICPGLLWTRAWELLSTRMKEQQPAFAALSPRQIFEQVVGASTPLGGEQTPEDIGNLAVFYSSDEARMITGQVVAVDGGITLKGGR